MLENAIVTDKLTKTFGDFTAVDHISFDVRKGEIFGFLGPNGAGKSTTIRMLCTLSRPTEGTATVAGYDIMKDIMAKAGTTTSDGVPTYEYAQPDRPLQFGLFDGESIADLKSELMRDFSGRRMTVGSIIEQHKYGRPFISRNYKTALIELERQGSVVASRPAAERRANTLANDIEIEFSTLGAT